MLHKVVPITTKTIYGILLSAFTLTVPELFKKIQTNEFVIIGANAQKNLKKTACTETEGLALPFDKLKN